MLQCLKERLSSSDRALYFSADHLYFNQNSLYDFVAESFDFEGINYFFIDEIHKYKNWNQELKNLYDSFPEINVMFSGSSSIDLIKGHYDLSRRGLLKKLHGLSFREYLNFETGTQHTPISLQDLINRPKECCAEIANIPTLKKHFKNYLERGYYPFFKDSESSYLERIQNMIDKIIYEDISQFYPLKANNLGHLKEILTYLATIPPGEINANNLAKNMGIDAKTTKHYLEILHESQVIRLILPPKLGAAMLRKSKKAFLNNPSLHHAISHSLNCPPDLGTLRESFFISMLENAGYSPKYIDSGGDFCVDEHRFEIGGKSKKGHQLSKEHQSSFLVKDDILYATHRDIPLYLFGFLY